MPGVGSGAKLLLMGSESAGKSLTYSKRNKTRTSKEGEGKGKTENGLS